MNEDFFRDHLRGHLHGPDAGRYRHLLANGAFFPEGSAGSSSARTRHFQKEQKTSGKGCYANSQRFASMYPGVRYFEGYRSAVIDGRPCLSIPPIHHAWAIDGGLVADSTLPSDDLRRTAYFGVEIPAGFLREWIGKEYRVPGRVSVPVTISLGTPLLGWYLQIDSAQG